MAAGTTSQLRDRSVSENEGQLHPSGRPQTCSGPRTFPLWGGCQGFRPANRHRQTVFARRRFRPPNPGGKRAHHSIGPFGAPWDEVRLSHSAKINTERERDEINGILRPTVTGILHFVVQVPHKLDVLTATFVLGAISLPTSGTYQPWKCRC